MAEFGCSESYSATIDQLSQSYERLTQLLALLSTNSPNNTAQAILLVDKAMNCIASALSQLQSRFGNSPKSDDHRRNFTDPKKRIKKRKESWTIVTSVPHFDGHQWRKYGQKRIHSSEFHRSYYKCTHSKEQGCQATKTIQQNEDKFSNPPKYVVSYSMQHTCKAKETEQIPFVMDSSAIFNENSTSNNLVASAKIPPALPSLTEEIEQMNLMESMLLSSEVNWDFNTFSPMDFFNFDLEDPLW